MTKQYAAAKRAWAKKRAAIVALSKKGIPKAEIGRRYGISRQRVSCIVLQAERKERSDAS